MPKPPGRFDQTQEREIVNYGEKKALPTERAA